MLKVLRLRVLEFSQFQFHFQFNNQSYAMPNKYQTSRTSVQVLWIFSRKYDEQSINHCKDKTYKVFSIILVAFSIFQFSF